MLFSLTAFGAVTLISQIIPNEREELELRIQMQYKINTNYLGLMGKDSINSDGNLIYNLFGNDLDPVVRKINQLIHLNPGERILFLQYLAGHKGEYEIPDKIKEYFYENSRWEQYIAEEEEENSEQVVNDDSSFRVFPVLSNISNWIIMPFVFLFLLIDNGQIKKFFINLVPNRYFEMALTTVDNVDKAIGSYLRGTLIQCTVVGLTLFTGLLLLGFNLQIAFIIAVIAGLANAIPFLGPIIGLFISMLYVLLADSIDPIIPFISEEGVAVALIILIVFIQFLDEFFYQPLIMGKAVNLHPIVVFLGVLAGTILFGFAGTLFAIPAIVVLNVIVSTLFRQLKAYFIIY
jgi:predicted PurR-regulated permease PerM